MDLYKILKALDATFKVDLERKTVNVALPLSAFATTAAPEPSRPVADSRAILREAIERENYGQDASRALYYLASNRAGQISEATVMQSVASEELQKSGWTLESWPEYLCLFGTDIRLPVAEDGSTRLLPIHILRLGNMATVSNQTVFEICRFREWGYNYSDGGVTMGKHFVPYIDGSLRLWKVLEGLLNAE